MTTRRGDTVFVHILALQDRVLALPDFGARVIGAHLFGTSDPIPVTRSGAGTTITFPASAADAPDRVVVLLTQPASSKPPT